MFSLFQKVKERPKQPREKIPIEVGKTVRIVCYDCKAEIHVTLLSDWACLNGLRQLECCPVCKSEVIVQGL